MDQSTIAAMATPINGSSHCAPVIRMAMAPSQNSDVRNGVAEVVNQQAAEIQIAPAADQGERNPAIDRQRQQRDADHPAFVDGDGMKEAFERLIEKAQRHQDQQNGVGERGQNSGALIAIGALMIRGTRGPVQGDPGNQQRGNVGEIMERVADQGDGMAHVAAQQFGDNQQKGSGYRSGKHPAGHLLRKGANGRRSDRGHARGHASALLYRESRPEGQFERCSGALFSDAYKFTHMCAGR